LISDGQAEIMLWKSLF